MSFIGSILLVAGSAAAVSFAIFAGHALSVHHSGPVVAGTAALVAGIVLLAIYSRMGGRPTEPDGHH